MRILISTVMILAVFTLSLACGMSFCPMQAKATELTTQSKSDLPPCHETNKQSNDCDFMTNMDCLGLDLAQIDKDYETIQDISQIDFVWADITANYDFLLTSNHFIRGPPFGDTPLHLNSTDLYLTTQRLRI